MDLLEGIATRRSVREFTDEPVASAIETMLLRAAAQAPSGLNNQPWRFVSIRAAEKRAELAQLTRYGRILRAAPLALAVYCDSEAVYQPLKDYQAIGAAVQNLLLAAHAAGLGAVWLGEILNNREAVNRLLDVPERYELMAVVAVGHPRHRRQSSTRRDLDELILNRY